MFIELVQNDLIILVLFKLNHNAHAVAVRFVADIVNALDLFVLYQSCDGRDEIGFVDHVGNFRDHNGLFFPSCFQDGFGAHHKAAAARFIGVLDAVPSANQASGRKIRGLDVFTQLFDGDVWVFDKGRDPINHFA